MYTNKENAKSVEQIKQDYVQAVDPGLVDFIENVRSAPVGETNKLEYRISGISERQRADIERITGAPLYATCNFIKGSAIEHIENRHGAKGAADRSMTDIKRRRAGRVCHRQLRRRRLRAKPQG